MTKEELLELQPAEIAAALNEASSDKQAAMDAFGITAGDLAKAQVFYIKGEFIARAWGGYTSTKRTGNEAGDTANGVGDSDPSLGYKGV